MNNRKTYFIQNIGQKMFGKIVISEDYDRLGTNNGKDYGIYMRMSRKRISK